MKNNFSRKLLATILSVAMMMNSSAVAFAADEGANGAGSAIGTSSVGGETGKPETPPAPDAVKAQIDALAAAADAGEAPDANAVKAARAAYDALTDEEKAAFDPDTLALLVMLEAALAAVPMAGDAITILVDSNTTPYGGTDLKAAVSKVNMPGSIRTLKITAGTVTEEDWKALSKTLPLLKTFEIDAAVTSVANIPDSVSDSIFPSVNLTRVTIPQTIKVGNHAFKFCSSLTEVNLPAATSIGEYAFDSCSNLSTVTLPEATSIGKRAFKSCSGLSTVTLPEATSIVDEAFQYCTLLTTVTLPKATSIGAKAFDDCEKLASLSLPAVTTIGGGAFYNCEKLASLSLPAVTTIGGGAFLNCATLATLKLLAMPPTVTSSSIFDFCPKTNPLVILDADGNELTDPTALATAIAEYDKVVSPDTGTDTDGLWYGWTLPAAPELPKITITVNGGAAVGGASLSDAVTKSGVAAINITALKITAGEVTAADWEYFAGGNPGTTKSPFTALQTFEAEAAVTKVENIPNGASFVPIFPISIQTVTMPQVITVGNHTFFGCEDLTEVNLPKAATIDSYAFFNCKSLSSVSLPAATTVNEGAFGQCDLLATLELPKVTHIGGMAFMHCPQLATLKLPAAPPIITGGEFSGCPKTNPLVIVGADGITPLEGDALANAQKAYDDVTANGNVANDAKWYGWIIVESAAAGKITIKMDKDTNEYTGNNLKEAMESCHNVPFEPNADYDPGRTTALNIIAGEVTESDWQTMKAWRRDLRSLKTFQIAEGVKVANLPDTESDFSIFPKSIQTVKIPQITAVGKNVFRYCSALTSVSLPNVTTVGDFAFASCSDLTTVNLSTATTSIGANAFLGCRILAELKLGATPPTFVGDSAFQDCPRPRTLKLVKPDGTPLTGEALTTAQKNYDKVAEHIGTSTATDGLWYGWTIDGGTTAGHVCNGITFDKALPTSGQSLPAGNYYLDGDVNASANFFMPEGTVVNLCLNGHTLTTSNPNDGGTGSKFASMSLNRASTNLNIYDCSADNSGKITGGNGGDGGCIHNSYGILNLYGGTITGNTASKGGGVYNYSENLTLYGKASITGNTNRAGGASNLYYDRYYPIKVGGKLSGTIGITPSQLPDEYSEARIAIAASGYTLTADDLKCFVSDVAGYEVVQTTYDGKACFSLKKVVAKPAPGGKLEAPLTQDKVDGVFGEGNATLDNTATPPKITIDNSIIPEKPIEIETDVTIDLGGNTITGKPGQPGLVVGDGDKVTVSGGGTISGGDNPGGAGGNGITGGAGSDITIGGGVTVEGGDGGAGGDGIQSGGNVTVDGSVSGGSGSSGNGGDGVDTSTGSGDITIGNGGSANGGNSTGGNGNGGDGTSSGGNTIIGGDVTGGNGNGSGSGGNGTTTGSGDTTISGGGSATGGTGGNASSGTGGAGGNGSISTGGGSIEVGGKTEGGNGGSGATGGTGGNGTSTGGSTTVTGGGTATGGAGGSGSTSGGNGGNGASSGSTTVNGGAAGGSGGSGKPGSNGNGGNGGSGVNQGSGTVEGSGTATGGNGGSGAGTGSGGNGGAGVGGGAKPGDNLIVQNGISAKVEVVGDAKTEVKLPDPAKTVNAILTPEEKADPTITDVKVTLKVDDKTAAKPDQAAVESKKPANSVIGAFFDITLQKTITKNNVVGSPETVTNVPNGVVTITIEIPSAMQGGSDYVIIRVHNGTGEALTTTQSGNELTFETNKFSTYAIAYTPAGTPDPDPGPGPNPNPGPSGGGSGGGSGDGSGDGSGGSSSDDGYDFWMTVKEKIQNAHSGDVVKVNAKGYDKMPSGVMDALRKNSGVSLVVTWSGKTITIPAGKAQKNESGRIYWPLSKLVELYANIAEDAVLKPAEQTNPTTGGPGKYIPVTGGGELITLEAPSPTIENTLPNGTENTLPNSMENTQAIAPTQPKAITSPDAGFEQDAFAGTPDAKQATDSNAFAVIALMLAVAAVGSGVWFWKKRHENERSSGT